MIASGLVMLISVAGAVVAVGVKNIVHAIFGLGVSLAGIALAFLLLGTPFVAAMQVLIYIGGITIAMVFAVMLSSMGKRESDGSLKRQALAAGVCVLFFIAMATVVVSADFGPVSPTASGTLTPEQLESAWSVKAIGRALLDHYNVAFELLSVVLLLVIVGAITIAARHDHGPDPVFEEECDQ
jgi:NADH:ubiquinone oxidoreductase subunit 6 (subunit J)